MIAIICDKTNITDKLENFTYDDISEVFCVYEQDDSEIAAIDYVRMIIEENKGEEILFVFNVSELTVSDLKQMKAVMDISEHHSFIVNVNNPLGGKYYKTDRLQGAGVLVKPKYPSIIGDFGKSSKDLLDALQSWAENSAQCGYNIIAVNKYNEPYKKKILIYANMLGAVMNGTTIHVLSETSALLKLNDDRYDIKVLLNEEIDNLFKMREKYADRVCFPDEIPYDALFDLALIPIHASDMEMQHFLSLHALRWVIWPLDCIGFRIQKQITYEEMSMNQMLDYVDGIIYSTYGAKNDFESYFHSNIKIKEIPHKIIALAGRESGDSVEGYNQDKEIPFSAFALVVGNRYPHKLIDRIIPFLSEIDEKFIVIGTEKKGWIRENIFGFISGNLTNKFVRDLHSNCKFLIFPSIYEGYGLPILDALCFDKEVIILDTPSNHDVVIDVGDQASRIHFISDFDELKECIKSINIEDKIDVDKFKQRTWDDVGKDIFSFFNSFFLSEPDLDRIKKRHDDIGYTYRQIMRLRVLNYVLEGEVREVYKKKTIDIYGYGNNCRKMLRRISDQVDINCIVDVRRDIKSTRERFISYDKYKHKKDCIIVVMPVYDYAEIEHRLVIDKGVGKSEIISVFDFLEKKIDVQEEYE